MVNRIVGTLTRWRGPCRDGHAWTRRADPVACSRCGRTRVGAAQRF